MGSPQKSALEQLNHMSDVAPQSITIESTNRPWLGDWLHWVFVDSKEVGSIYIIDGKVSTIEFIPNEKPSLKSLIGLYGVPDRILLTKEQLDGTYLDVYLFYEKGICMHFIPGRLPFINWKKYRIKPSMEIDYVYYSDNAIPDWEVGCTNGMRKEFFQSYLQNWKGYGIYPLSQINPAMSK
jgi:hypothetical protein